MFPSGFRQGPPPPRNETPEEHIEAIRLTRLLCELCGTLEESEMTGLMTVELREWWKEHRTADHRRLRRAMDEQERARIVRAAYKKLTPEQRLAVWGPSEKPARKKRRTQEV